MDLPRVLDGRNGKREREGGICRVRDGRNRERERERERSVLSI